MQSFISTQVFSNIKIFYEIAKDSFSDSEKFLSEHRKPKENGGYILSFDPEKKSLKSSLISISFSGAYIDLHINIAYILTHGKSPNHKWETRIYEEKLKDLGVTNLELFNNCTEFRKIRNSVLHEKPLVIGESLGISVGTAQDGARLGISVIETIREIIPLIT